ncbi:MAG TPA: ectonucleotide pyrophosphatase/phosphodiesterase, partial [Bacteroidales bacterium]|nr:ectonucleotide pyrophosphatase/phosphodiesterase [Bacteroidales bacterium]
SLIPCFPTKTFPNHYSIATGLYPDHHGIIQNSFYVPGIGTFEPTNRQSIMNGAYYEGEPIWLTAENQGMKSACCFWVGSEAPIKGKYPSIWLPYNQDLPFTSRIDSVITWLQLPSEKRPHLIMWYIHQPDEISHHEGPLAASTGKMISYLDSLVGVFRARLNELPIANKVNFVVVSDHGMAKVNENNNLYLDHLVPRYWINMACGGDIQLNITATPGYKDSLYHRLKKVNHLSVWKKEEVPQRLHYGTNPRIYDLVVLADTGWNIMLTQPAKIIPGHHGYDNIYPDMHGIFYAVGPAFKNGYERPSFENIHLYPLFTHILKLKPAEVDGRLEEVRDMLKN